MLKSTQKVLPSVTVGTTHFINAIHVLHLSPYFVFVVRFLTLFLLQSIGPSDLRSIICAYCGFLDGGFEIDGQIIRDVNEDQVRGECEKIRAAGIRSVVVNGIFAPAANGSRSIIRKRKLFFPRKLTISAVANLGFIERENAAILNASILAFARHTISQFQAAIHRRLQLSCPGSLTQNDGTILQAADAARLPIRTFNGGPTNSMCGAGFLVKGAGSGEANSNRESMLVVDTCGTTTGWSFPSSSRSAQFTYYNRRRYVASKWSSATSSGNNRDCWRSDELFVS
ncbi:hypothetical protein VNI00_016472 [Paramarasmius palmivorus]|uniref:Hydantoinase/oxoprolinase N-terminal domain-containing protein n=1 Tax=Paramarasmius palmivorus TaxID=297713 RepID=A0AAW0BF55_9AGAR